MSSSVVSSATFRGSSSSLVRLNPIASQRVKKEIEERRGDINTYTFPIIFAGDIDRTEFLQAHYKKFLNASKTSKYRSQVLKKYPTTVGKFYHDLVEHSGRVTSEEFWLRYDYRCCDIARIHFELKSIRQESKKQLVKEKKKAEKKGSAKEASHLEEHKKKSTRSTNTSWMNIRRFVSFRKSFEPSVQGGIEAAATADTADDEEEEYHDGMGEDHVENFKKSIGAGDVSCLYVSPDEGAKVLEEQEDSLEESNLPDIFRSSPKSADGFCAESKGLFRDLKFPALLIGVWLSILILAFVVQSPSLWMSKTLANKICSPIRPGTVLEASQIFAEKNESGASRVFTAPWWVPPSMKDKVFDSLCASDSHGISRVQTQLTCEVQSKTFFQTENVHYLSATVSQIGGEEDGKVLIRVRASKSLSANSVGTKLIAEKYNGELKEYESPWMLL